METWYYPNLSGCLFFSLNAFIIYLFVASQFYNANIVLSNNITLQKRVGLFICMSLLHQLILLTIVSLKLML